MKAVKIIITALIVIFVAVQFVPSGIPGNKPEDMEGVANDSLMTEPVLEQLRISCFDCHSNQVNLPWYARVAPSSWLLADHINEGRSHLNFSEWGTYSNREKIGLLDGIRDEITSGGMPLRSYLLIHREARLDTAATSAILKWTDGAMARILE
jgi:hypothetical protein